MGMIKEKVVKALERCPSLPFDLCCAECADCNCPYYDESGIKKLHQDVLALLKEQEAVEARKKNDGKPQPWTSWWYVCGDCGQEIEYHDRFCRWCGRSVKWK